MGDIMNKKYQPPTSTLIYKGQSMGNYYAKKHYIFPNMLPQHNSYI